MQKRFRQLILLLVISVFSSCVGDGSPTVRIQRMDLAIEESGDSLRDMSPGIEALRRMMNAPEKMSDSDFVDSLSGTTPVKVFTPDVRHRLQSLDGIERELGMLKSNMLHYLPEVDFPSSVYAVINPYSQPIVIVDSVILIGSNHYLGVDYPGYESFERYRVPFKTPKNISYDVGSTLIRQHYPYSASDSESTLLSRLLYEGAVAYALGRLIPNSDMALAVGIDPQAFDEVVKNEALIYATMISRRLLYTTSPADISRLVSPAPASSLISPSAPGRCACFVGERIVESYVEHNGDVSIDFLLSPDFYCSPQSFVEAQYQPRGPKK